MVCRQVASARSSMSCACPTTSATTDFIKRNTHRTTDTTETNRESTSVTTTATISYIKGTSEAIAWILQPYNIRVAHKPITTLRHLLANVKDKDKPNKRQVANCQIECSDCQATYTGETGRNLNTRLRKPSFITSKPLTLWSPN